MTGLVTWTPGPAQAGTYVILFTASDGMVSSSQSIFIQAALKPTLPGVTIVLTPSYPVAQGTQVTVNAIASSIAPITGVTLTLNGQPVMLAASGAATITAGPPGQETLVATATDADGYTASTTNILKVLDPFDTTAPQVSLTPQLALSPFTGVTTITGTVTSANLDSWTLGLAILGSKSFTTIGSGTAPVSGGALGRVDPGTLANGFYELQLTATDIAGRTSVTQLESEVDSAKPAAVQTSDTDLTVTLDGATISITRAYNSVSPAGPASFGPGWTLVNRDVDLQTSLAPTGLESYGVYPAMQQGTRLYLTLPDGDRAGFTFNPMPVSLPDQPSELTYYYPAWKADTGVTYELTSVQTLLVKGGNDYYDQATGLPYNPLNPYFGATGYTLTAADGSQELIGANGVAEFITAAGQVFHVSDSGITAQDGETIRFVEDNDGRIAAIQAPSGETINYVYGVDGSLAEVVSSTRGVLYRYGYDLSTGALNVAVRTGGGSDAYLPGQPPRVAPLTADLGDALQFDNQSVNGGASGTLPAGATQDYSFSLSAAEVASTNAGSVIVRVDVSSNASLPRRQPSPAWHRWLCTSTAARPSHCIKSTREALTWSASKESRHPPRAPTKSLWTSPATSTATESSTASIASFWPPRSAARPAAPAYNFAADLDGNGVINGADQQLLDFNYGLAADKATPAFPNYFAAPTGSIWTPTSSGGNSGNNGNGGNSSGAGTPPAGPTLTPTQPAPAPPTVTIPAPIPLAPTTNPVFGITNGDFSVIDPTAPGFGWTTRGQVTVANGSATLLDGGPINTALTQAFLIPNGTTTLSFLIDSATLGESPNMPPDAFEVALLNARTLQPLTSTVTGLSDTDAFLNVQSDGTYFASPLVTIANLTQNGGILGDTMPRLVELDVSGVPANTLAVLSFDLIGFERQAAA